MTKIITTQKIDNENYDVYLNGWLGDEHYEDAYFGGLVFKFGTWVLVQNTATETNSETDYQTDDLDEVISDIECEINESIKTDGLETFEKFLSIQ